MAGPLWLNFKVPGHPNSVLLFLPANYTSVQAEVEDNRRDKTTTSLREMSDNHSSQPHTPILRRGLIRQKKTLKKTPV